MSIIGRISAILVILLSSQVSRSQKIVDTTGLYNGEYTKKRIEFSAAGLTEKETWYYPNGRIEQENFYHDGVPYHLISFDQDGKRTSEWGDREYVLGKWKKTRLWVLSLTVVCLVGLTIAAARKDFGNTFYIFLVLTLFVPFLIMVAENRMPAADGNRNFDLIVAALIFLIPGCLLILSLISLTRRKQIPRYISIIAMLISIAFLLVFGMVAGAAGAGMLG
jgi:hypothetical protein